MMNTERRVSYSETGAIQGEYEYLNGQLHGESIWYDEVGNPVQRGCYQQGLLEGEFSIYNENQLFSTTQYHKGKKQGEQIIYNEQQQPICRMTYLHDLLHGKSIWYAPEGHIIKLAHYATNQLHGKVLHYIGPGILYEKSTYRFGKLDGYLLRYDQAGKPQVKTRYRKGEPIQENKATTAEEVEHE